MPSAAVILSTSLGIVTLSAIACSISFASAQQLPAATTPPAPTSAAQTQQPHPTPAGQVIITQCPSAPTNFLANNWSDNSSTDTLSVRFASEAVARAPVVWFRLADALCVPHDALLIAAVRPAEAAGELRVDCARAPPTAECDVRARVAYALYLDAERPAALRAIGVESLAPVAVAPPTDAPSPGFAAASTRAPAGADASHPHESSGDDTALLVVFAAVCVLVVAVAAALVVCAVCFSKRMAAARREQQPPDAKDATKNCGDSSSQPHPPPFAINGSAASVAMHALDDAPPPCWSVMDLRFPPGPDGHALSPPPAESTIAPDAPNDQPCELDFRPDLSLSASCSPTSAAAAVMPRRGDIFGFHA